MKSRTLALIAVALLAGPVAANAVVLRITATSGSVGQLGWFDVDDSVLAVDTSLVASQFVSYGFDDPLSSVSINPGNVGGDTGVTYFGIVSGVWTVIGGGSDSLTNTLNQAVWIAGNDFLWFRNPLAPNGGNSYSDVRWSTSVVPEPGTLALLGLGLAGLGLSRRRKAN